MAQTISHQPKALRAFLAFGNNRPLCYASDCVTPFAIDVMNRETAASVDYSIIY